jgi:hypothetical protein
MASKNHFSGVVDDVWLAQQREDIIEPDLPIVDPHHHLWNHPGNIYLFPELIADLSSGHNIRARSSRNAIRCTALTDQRSLDRWARPSSLPVWPR